MNISAIKSTNTTFSGKYQVNVNQAMPTPEDSLERDLMLGIWLKDANNYEQLTSKLDNFFHNEYKENSNAPCNVIYDIPDSEDNHFEKCMNNIGQKFNKIA